MFKIMQILYLDDGAFIFETRNELIKGVNIINSLFKKFGMEMHVGRNEKASKTECIMFPAPGALTQKYIENPNAPPLIENPSHSPSQTDDPIPGNTSPEAEPSSSELKDPLLKIKKRRKKKKLHR